MTRRDNGGDVQPHVPLTTIAAQLGYGAKGFTRAVVTRGFKPFQLKSGSNQPYYLTDADASALKKIISEERFRVANPIEIERGTGGGVYFIEVPSYGGELRVKIGWADKFSDRFSDYRTIVPELRVCAVWRTNDRWTERMAHKVAQGLGRRVSPELFVFDDNAAALSKLKTIFETIGVGCSDSPPEPLSVKETLNLFRNLRRNETAEH
jgi:hypothetical protein